MGRVFEKSFLTEIAEKQSFSAASNYRAFITRPAGVFG